MPENPEAQKPDAEVKAPAGPSAEVAAAPPPNAAGADKTSQAAVTPPAEARANAPAEPSTPLAVAEAQEPAPETERKGMSSRPIRWGVFAVAAMAPALCVGILMSSHHGAGQAVAIEGFQRSLDRVDQRLAEIQSRAEAAAQPEKRSETTSDYASLVNAANLCFRNGQFAEAARSYREALKTDPATKASDEAHYGLGMSLLKSGDTEGALAEFRALVTEFPGSPHYADATIELAQLLMKKKSFAQARRVLFQLVGVKGRLAVDDQDCVERAQFMIARSFEGEAEVAEASRPGPMAFSVSPKKAGGE